MNLDELAGRFKSARKSGNSYKALCPCHDDRTSSLSIFLNQAGNLTVKCFVGCRREAILAAVGLTWQDLNGVAKRQDWTLDVPNELPPTTHPKLGKTSKQWTYLNRAGKVLCYVYRFETPAGKEFRPLTYWRTGTRAEWRWTAPPDPKPLYNCHKLAAKPEAIVILTEGEKAADAAAELFPEFVTVTTMNGAQSPHKSDFKPLAGREVWIWPDNDEPGQEYARAIARLCLKAGARELKVLEIKGD